MPRYYVENKKGKWNIYSTIVDDLLFDNFVDFKEMKDFVLNEEREEKLAILGVCETLKLENQRLCEENQVFKKALEKVDKYTATKAVVSSGKKVAYKEEIDNTKIIQMLREGMAKTEVAKILGITRQTLYNRIKQIEAAGIEI